MPTAWWTVTVQLADPEAFVVPVHVCAPAPEPSVSVSVLPEIGAPPIVFSTPESVIVLP